MALTPGTIVTVDRQPGYWAIADMDVHAIPPGRRWRLIGTPVDWHGLEVQTSRVVGDGNIIVIAEPAFTPDQIVQFGGLPAEVVLDQPEAGLVRIRQTKPRNPRLGGTRTGVSDVGRGNLVLENLSSILKGVTNGE